jgi:hypothetical protein
MSPSEIEDNIFREPFVPVRLTLASGDQIIIDNPRRAVITGLSIYYALADNPEARVGTSGKFISIPNIVLVEPAPPGPHRNGRRRRR